MRLSLAPLTLAIAGLFFGLGCRSMPGAGSAGESGEYGALDAATAHYALMLRGAPPDSVAASFTSDGELIIPGIEPVRGRAAIVKFLAPMTATTHVVSVEMKPDSEKITGTGAQQAGHYVQVAGPRGGATQTYRGTYDALWRREADGRWRFVRLTMRPAP